jgi:hypothetical protein
MTSFLVNENGYTIYNIQFKDVAQVFQPCVFNVGLRAKMVGVKNNIHEMRAIIF